MVRIIKKSPGVKVERSIFKGGRVETKKKSRRGSGIAADTTKFIINIKDTRTGKTTTTTVNTKSSSARAAEKRRAEAQLRPSPTLKQIQDTRGLQARIVEEKTGRVVQQGRFKVDQEAERLIRNALKAQRIMQEKEFQRLNAQKITSLLTPSQQTQIYRSIAATSYDPLPASIRIRFREIDKQPGTTFLQKEEQKRRVAGISSADPNAQGFFRKPTVTEFKSTLNTIKPSDFKIDRIRPGIIGGLIYGYQQLPKFNNWLEQQRKKAIRNNKNAQAAMIGVASLPTNFVQSYGNIIIGIASLITNPIDSYRAISNLTKKDIEEAASNLGVRIQQGQPSVVTDIAAEIITQKYGLGLIKGARQLQRLRPSFVKATGETFVIKKSPFKSVSEFLKNPKNPISTVFRRNPEIILKKQTVKTGAQTLAEQTKIAGKTVTAVNAAADQLTSWIKRKQIVRKPIPGESDFPKTIKNLLEKFDSGIKLSKKEFARVNLWLKKNVAPNITLLERSLYADPASGLRVSRLGIKRAPTATLKDILRGNFKLFDRTKPQVLIFQNAKVAKFPKSLKDVETKLKAGIKLTEEQTNRLIAWQVKTGSGKFKPVGSTIYKGGIELEVTLAPGEFIKRLKQVGFTFIDGKKVTFVTAEAWKPPKQLLNRLNKAKDGKLSDVQVKSLEKELSKGLGRKINVETPNTRISKIRRTRSDVPVLRISPKGLRVSGFISRKLTTRATKSRATTTRATTSKRITTIKRAPTTRTTKRRSHTARSSTARSSTARAPTARSSTARSSTARSSTARSSTARSSTARAPIPRISFDSKKLDDKILTFDALYRERKDIRKPASRSNPVVQKRLRLNTTRNRALRKVMDLVDNRAVRSIELRIVGVSNKKLKDIQEPTKSIKFNKKKSKGTPVLRLVEKAKYTIDSKGESRELKRSKAIKKYTKTKKSSRMSSKVSRINSNTKRKT